MPINRLFVTVASLSLFFSPLPAARADEVRLKNGGLIIGLVVQDTPKLVGIRVNGDLRLFKQAEVKSVRFTPEGTAGAVHLGRGRADPEVPPKEPPPEAPLKLRPYVEKARPASDTTPTPSAAFRDARVVLYGTSWCGFCARARRYFTERGIPFTDRDIEKEEDARAEVSEKCLQKGRRFTGGVPVIDVNGSIIHGFDERAIEAALGKS